MSLFFLIVSTATMNVADRPAFAYPQQPFQLKLEESKVEPEQQPQTPAQPQSPVPFGPLGSIEFRTNGAASLSEWRKVLDRMQSEQASYATCLEEHSSCPEAVRAWRKKLAELHDADRWTQLKAVNRYINHASPYSEDIDHYGRADYWATPTEFLTSSGDCEDYAIAKFYSLLALGFSNDQLRIIVVHDRERNVDHAVVSVAEGEDTFILDSRFDTPVRHEHMLGYEPVYSVNLTSRWGHIVTAQIRDRFVTYVAERDMAKNRERIDAALPAAFTDEGNAAGARTADSAVLN